eukprot:CAMPEP_0177778780 /NCGR_PEP_ID=MMETSP0491_2-20121128/16161_1 /TAXON_ID=63592 /ORGANISM="Tetraselmis chuii, Strain PLY429" /LENGTH=119 /DNA_ID=CAMNT_0019298125 /DNA_START=162 /DNA_END=517 /DNA_ORIENTATION=+
MAPPGEGLDTNTAPSAPAAETTPICNSLFVKSLLQRRHKITHGVLSHHGHGAAAPSRACETATDGTSFPTDRHQLLQLRAATVVELAAAAVAAVHQLAQCRQEALHARPLRVFGAQSSK